MALIDPNQISRVDIPTEPGEWVELRPITARDLGTIQKDSIDLTRAELTLRILSVCLIAWSYSVPVTLENLGRLDVETFNWLDEQLIITSGRQDDDGKKDSAKLSSLTTDLGTGDSPPSSITSERSRGSKSKV